MTTPERPGDWPYGAEQPAAGQQPYVEPPIPGMPYNAQPSAEAQPLYPPAPPAQQFQPQFQAQIQPQYQQFQPGPYQQPYPYPYPQYAPPTSTNGMAIASMVLGILWIYWIGSILALIFGYVARDQIKRSGQQGDGMAIAGIVLGWVGIGFLILAITIWSSLWW